MNTYNIPRNVKGEGRILYVFSTKALIYTFIGIAIGFIFYLVFNALNLQTVGIIILAIFSPPVFLVISKAVVSGTLNVAITNPINPNIANIIIPTV